VTTLPDAARSFVREWSDPETSLNDLLGAVESAWDDLIFEAEEASRKIEQELTAEADADSDWNTVPF
jgi:hypothetical protein